MPIVQVPAQLTVEHLMAAIKQLSPIELHEFTQQLTAWQQENGQPAAEEATLLACIQANSHLPDAEQRRYERLRRKCERRTLTERELREYQALLQQLEARNVKRIEALIALERVMHVDRGSPYMDAERERNIARHPRAACPVLDTGAGIQSHGTPWIPAYAGMTNLPYARYVCTPECITRSSAVAWYNIAGPDG